MVPLSGNHWKLQPVQFGLVVNLCFGVLMSVHHVIYHKLLSHKTKLLLRRFHVDLIHSLWLIGHLVKILTYPGIVQYCHTAILITIFV